MDSKAPRSGLIRFTVFLLAVSLLLIAGVAGSHYVAAHLPAGLRLGEKIGGFFIPWAWVGWIDYYAMATDAFATVFVGSMVVFAVCLFGGVLAVGMLTRSTYHTPGLHGSAHFATRAEIEEAGLLPSRGKRGAGVYVGGWTDTKTGALHYLRHDGPEHVAAIAPTRSGKGVGLVVPTLLSWPASAVVTDRKGELWSLTSGWRAGEGGNHVLRFNPSSPTYEGMSRFNPLGEIRIGSESEVGDAQNIASMLADPKGEGLNDHWSKTAFAFLTGAILHECYKSREDGAIATLAGVLLAITDPARDSAQYYEEMMANRHDVADMYGMDGMHAVVAAEGRTMANKPDDERGSVLSTAVSYLSLYRDPIVAKHTASSDFQLSDLMNAERPVTLYLTSRDEDADRMKPLFRLILNQIVRVLLRPEIRFEQGRAVPPHRHRLLLMLDEFPAFGRLEIFQSALAFIAGYGIKAYLIAQDIAQLTAAYGKDETVTANCHIKSAYAPNRVETGEWLSKMTGTTTELTVDVTESGKRFAVFGDGYSRSAREIKRPLMTADETMRLKAPKKAADGAIQAAGEMLTFVAGHAPILGTQPLYFRDPEFLRRSSIPPPAARPQTPAATPKASLSSTSTEQLQTFLWGASRERPEG